MARVTAIFQSAGIQVETCGTTHAGSAIIQTQEAVAAGFDTIVACGGDGTANEVLNGLMQCNASASLGVVPLGSGNLLATDLLLPRNPEMAAQRLLQYKPCELNPGMLVCQTKEGPQPRYFIEIGRASCRERVEIWVGGVSM